QTSLTICIEPEVKVVMLEMLVNNFFGAEISNEELKTHYMPALERIIEHIVRDTIFGQLAVIGWTASLFRSRDKTFRKDNAVFEQLTDLVLAGRKAGRGLWNQFKADVPDEALRGNLKVFLAGA